MPYLFKEIREKEAMAASKREINTELCDVCTMMIYESLDQSIEKKKNQSAFGNLTGAMDT